MSFEDRINNKLLKIWESNFPPNDDDALMPLFFPKLRRNCLLFVGMNPSFSEKGFITMTKGTKYEDIDAGSFFKWKNRAKFEPQVSFELGEISREKYPFFNKHKKIANFVGLEWEHIDLFHYRQTNQNEFKKKIFKDKSGVKLNQFGEQQFDIFHEVIKHIAPRLIVIANAQASRIFENKFNPKFQESSGHHIFTVGNKTPVPLFLCSMLTGQRALDNYSFQRLKWHIKMALAEN